MDFSCSRAAVRGFYRREYWPSAAYIFCQNKCRLQQFNQFCISGRKEEELRGNALDTHSEIQLLLLGGVCNTTNPFEFSIAN